VGAGAIIFFGANLIVPVNRRRIFRAFSHFFPARLKQIGGETHIYILCGRKKI
jgi:hypothetical protein